jgi:peptidyl-prolyl cis-trans isomerase SurA
VECRSGAMCHPAVPPHDHRGTHMTRVELLEKKGNEYNSRHILIKPESGEEDIMVSFTRLDSIRKALVGDSIKFEDAAKKYSEDKETTQNGGFFADPQTGLTKIATENLDPAIFFKIDSLKPGTYTKPEAFKTQDGKKGARILYFKSKILPHEANLKQDYQKIQMATLEKKKGEAIKSWFRKTKSEVFISREKDYADCEILKDEDF